MTNPSRRGPISCQGQGEGDSLQAVPGCNSTKSVDSSSRCQATAPLSCSPGVEGRVAGRHPQQGEGGATQYEPNVNDA